MNSFNEEAERILMASTQKWDFDELDRIVAQDDTFSNKINGKRKSVPVGGDDRWNKRHNVHKTQQTPRFKAINQ